EPILSFEDTGIHRIISMIPNIEDIRDFCQDFLGDLKRYDPENGKVLLETLHVYLLSNCSIKETAKKMFLHPNTVAYRIKKIREIVKYDLDSIEYKFAYLFALEADAMLDGQPAQK